MSNSITKVAVIGTGVIGAGWIIRALAHNKNVVAYDKELKLEEKLVAEIKRTWPYVKKLFNKKKVKQYIQVNILPYILYLLARFIYLTKF